MKWFGAPWPSSHRRAVVCEDEDDHVPVPSGTPCGGPCRTYIMPDDQGVLMPFLGAGDDEFSVVPWHVDCVVRVVLPERPYPGP